LSEVFRGDPAALVDAAKDLSFEGIVAKRKDSVYESGKRTGAWVKYKVNRSQEFVIGEVASKFKGLEIDTCPFANLPEKKQTQWALTKDEMKNCVWLKPELVAQIEFTEWTPDGHPRHSKLKDDKEAREVVREIES
jgi:ATP-dependent DNA ligase